MLGATPVQLTFGSVDYERGGDEQTVREAVTAAVDGAEFVLLPGPPLSHPDHEWLARALVGAFGRPVALYAEQPYTLRSGREPMPPDWLAAAARDDVSSSRSPSAARAPREVARGSPVPLPAPVARAATEPAWWRAPLRVRPGADRHRRRLSRGLRNTDRAGRRFGCPAGGVPWRGGVPATAPGGVAATRRHAQGRRVTCSPRVRAAAASGCSVGDRRRGSDRVRRAPQLVEMPLLNPDELRYTLAARGIADGEWLNLGSRLRLWAGVSLRRGAAHRPRRGYGERVSVRQGRTRCSSRLPPSRSTSSRGGCCRSGGASQWRPCVAIPRRSTRHSS